MDTLYRFMAVEPLPVVKRVRTNEPAPTRSVYGEQLAIIDGHSIHSDGSGLYCVFRGPEMVLTGDILKVGKLLEKLARC